MMNAHRHRHLHPSILLRVFAPGDYRSQIKAVVIEYMELTGIEAYPRDARSIKGIGRVVRNAEPAVVFMRGEILVYAIMKGNKVRVILGYQTRYQLIFGMKRYMRG